MLPDIDVVVIGINCEATLLECLQSVFDSNYDLSKLHVYYVDSGSSDGSVEIANSFPDVTAIELRPAHPTPGAGRNAGWKAGSSPVVQFLDSDTVMDPNWLSAGVEAMTGSVGAVSGYCSEKFPTATKYNFIANLEWNSSPGDIEAFGGIVLILRSILEELGGYDGQIIAGEDPDLSRRVRNHGYRILQLDQPMVMHDIAMTRFSQYWRRAVRSGYAFGILADRAKDSTNLSAARSRILVRGLGWIPILIIAIFCTETIAVSTILILLASLLLLYPRLFRIKNLMKEKGLDTASAKLYAWHCSLVVVPQAFGFLRYWAGKISNRPMRNKIKKLATRSTRLSTLLLCVLCTLLSSSCRNITPKQTSGLQDNLVFNRETVDVKSSMTTAAEVQALSKSVPTEYMIGAGDVVSIQITGRPELSSESTLVAPDGTISIPRIGQIAITGLTRGEASDAIHSKLEALYSNPEVSLTVQQYRNNKAFVLGRVSNPGIVHFPGPGTLIEAISLAGGVPSVSPNNPYPTECAIIRGNEQILWIDLDDLFTNGNMALNAAISPNDVIFVPEAKQALVYVMGAVGRPGAMAIRKDMTYLDALMQSGGPTENANLSKTFLIRWDGKESVVKELNLADLISSGNLTQNYLLKDNDVIFVAEKGIARWNYYIRQITPTFRLINLVKSTSNVVETFGE